MRAGEGFQAYTGHGRGTNSPEIAYLSRLVRRRYGAFGQPLATVFEPWHQKGPMRRAP